MRTNKYYPLSRFDELYYPSTVTFQFWLAFLSFMLFIFTLLFKYSPSQGWFVMETSVSEYAGYLQYVFWGIAVIVVLMALFALISFIVVCLRAVFGIKKKGDKYDKPNEHIDSTL
jgi:hypothetical protein